MNGDVAVHDVMTRDYVGVSEGDAVAGVAALMVDAGVDGAVVLRGAEPVGLLDCRDVVALVATERDPSSVTAGELCRGSPTTVRPDAPLEQAVAELTGREARILVVMDRDEVVGTLSVEDVVAARSTFPEEVPAEAAVAGEGGPADDRYSTQSVCEACGALASELANVNGQLLCADCREI